MICIYHSADLDGHCSAAIVRRAHPEAELVGLDYGRPIPWERLRGQQVVMVDFSLQPWDQMRRLFNECEHLLWVDHHRTAVKDLQDQPLSLAEQPKVEAVVLEGQAGCELTYGRLFPQQPMPEAVRLLGRYDVWDERNPQWDSHILPFQWGMRTIEHMPEEPIWDRLLGSETVDLAFIESLIIRGRTCLEYERIHSLQYAQARAFKTELLFGTQWLPAIGLNRGLCNSRAFDGVWDPEKYALMIAFCLTPEGHWKVALYTTRTDIDCGQIAKTYGGGGHPRAAGFQAKTLPFSPGGRP